MERKYKAKDKVIDMKKISILMLTHNAPRYVLKSIRTLKKMTVGVDYELIVIDNASHFPTRLLLKHLSKKGYIEKIQYNTQNVFFAKGNNQACDLASTDSEYFLLLNSDVKICSPDWLTTLLSVHPKEGGISSFGAVMSEPVRADGYCMLINQEIYNKFRLDEQYEWFWSVTQLESQTLHEGYRVRAVANHEKYLHHYGQKSGRAYKSAAGMDTKLEEVKKWFSDVCIEVIEDI